MQKKIHLAIIDADIPAPALYAARGLYSAQFEKILQKAVTQLSHIKEYEKYDIKLHVTAYDLLAGVYPPLEHLRTTTNETTKDDPIDAILITGAPPGAYETDKYPWIVDLEKYIRHIFDKYPCVRMLGSCFGHQVIAQALLPNDVIVEKSPLGREAGLYTIQTDPAFAKCFPILSTLPYGVTLQMMHGDWVISRSGRDTNGINEALSANLPSPWMRTGYTDICPIQGLYYPGRILTIQGHFEQDGFAMKEMCMEFSSNLKWSQEYLDSALQRINPDPSHYEDNADMVAMNVVLFLAGIENDSKQ
ncbi:hypothetical protein MW887_006512 [Aspergillus wentii]|nr:hypothetical protein MW887_006512 [Aspergillus wentii]